MPVTPLFRQFSGALIWLTFTALLLGACENTERAADEADTSIADSVQTPGITTADPYLWLEDILGEKSLNWVRAENARTLGVLEADPRFRQVW